MKTMPPESEMQRACRERDATYDGLFFIAVRTTKIFCRPTCPARTPLPENVRYFPTATEALEAGYRACKRCRPLELDDRPPWVESLIAEVDRDPSARITDGDLKAKGIDPGTVRRYFRRQFGMTFQAWARSRRLTGALGMIRGNEPIDSAVFRSGYESHSGFRDAFVRAFGEPPARARDKKCVVVSWLRSPLGLLVAGATEDGICLLEFTDRGRLEAQVGVLRRLFALPIVPGSNAHLDRLQGELGRYFDGASNCFTVPLVYPGTPFQAKVWEQLRAIPYGETRSYEQIAIAVGSPGAVRAVGTANGRNRIAILLPCHRVVNKSGKLGGYGGGLWRKQHLLDLEREHAGHGAQTRRGTSTFISPGR
jgi:AraC family transcriptional regulator of adaptative response/methylated-DNA-[protein]-cysteine methyltransferase